MQSSEPKKSYLNIYFFVDGGRTRTGKLPLSWVKAGAAFLGLLIVWMAIASFLLIHHLYRNKTLETRLEGALETVFQYQIKQEHLLEEVYSLEKKPISPSPAHVPEIKTPETAQSTPPQVPEINLLLARHFSISPTQGSDKVLLYEPHLSKREKTITLSFAVKNKLSNARAEGHIWSATTWKDADGNVKVVKMIGDAGETIHQDTKTFSIRQFKIEKFHYPIPSPSSRLEKVDIWISDRRGGQTHFQVLGKE